MKEYIIHDPLGDIICKLPDNHCVFCVHCCDLLYDYSNGPYMFLCDVNGVPAKFNECKMFKEVNNE